jgi:dihydrofolate reductase
MDKRTPTPFLRSRPFFQSSWFKPIDRVFKEKCDLLLGRKTYEIFAAYWPYYDETASHGGIAKLFKDIKKYVVSRSGDVDTSWQGSCCCETSPT